MADKKISQLTAVSTPLAGTEELPAVQSATTKKVTVAQLQAAPVVAGTASTVQYLNTNKVPSTSSNLAFDGTNLGVGGVTTPHCFGGFNTGTFGANNNTVGCSFGIDSNGGTQPLAGMRWTGASGGINGTAYASQLVVDTANSPSGLEIFTTGGSPVYLGINAIPYLKVDTDVTALTGNFVVGTSGKGIDFSATAGTGTSELLADYEEGTWTPIITSAGGSITSYTSSGTYTKIGRSVTLTCTFTITDNGTGVGSVVVTGVPFSMVGGVGSAARETNVTGNTSSVSAISATQLILYNYANLYPAATGAAFAFSLVFNT